MKHWVLIAALFLGFGAHAQTDEELPYEKPKAPLPQAPEKGPRGAMGKGAILDGVYFKEPKDGAVLPTTFTVKFGVNGMRVKPAGELEVGTGHHHLIIRPIEKGAKKKFSLAEKTVVPTDETHIHYGKGQEEAEITLKPGEYFLTLQFADGAHQSYGLRWAQTIAVTVKQ